MQPLVIAIIGLGVLGVSLAHLASGRTISFSGYRAGMVYFPLMAALGVGLALAMACLWWKMRKRNKVRHQDRSTRR